MAAPKSLDGVFDLNGPTIFTVNKYYRWYWQIISNALIRNALSGYAELHHIIPKSLGGSNSSKNLVNLTAREHFVCHWLLTKCVIYNVEKMKYALWLMATTENSLQQRYKITPKKYEIIKKSLAETFSNQHTGKKLSEETKRKISETRKKKFDSGELTIKVYDATREKHSKSRTGSKRSQETKDKISKAHANKVISEEQKAYLSSLYKGKPRNDPEFKRKISDSMKAQYAAGTRLPTAGMKGKHMSEEAKEKIRQARFKYWREKKNGG